MSAELGKKRLLEELDAHIHKHLSGQQAADVAAFTRQYFDTFAADDLVDRTLPDLFGSIVGSWSFLQQVALDDIKIRVFNPHFEKHGWQLSHTVITAVGRNMPFMTDSVRGELNRRGKVIHTIHSSVHDVVRDGDGNLLELLAERGNQSVDAPNRYSEEAMLYVEIGRISDKGLRRELESVLQTVLMEVRVVADDFLPMLAAAENVAAALEQSSGAKAAHWQEIVALLNWLREGFFTFLGYEKVDVSYRDALPLVNTDSASALGMMKLRATGDEFNLFDEIRQADSRVAIVNNQLIICKSMQRSRVHRVVYPDYIAVKIFDDSDRVICEHRFLGLFASRAYNLSPRLIPLLKHKVAALMARSELEPQSHDGKNYERILEVFPRDELFQCGLDELFETTMAVLEIKERRRVRVFMHLDFYGNFVNCLVYIPRDIYHTELRIKVQEILADAIGADEAEFTTFFSESILTRTHFVFRVKPGHHVDIDRQALEAEIIQVTMTWQDHLANHLREEFGEEQGAALTQRYKNAFPAGYMDDFEPRVAVNDIKKAISLKSDEDIAMNFYRILSETGQDLRFRLLHRHRPLHLSDVMPILDNLGLRVVGERPYGLKLADGDRVWVHEFTLIYRFNSSIDVNQLADNFQDAFARLWFGDAESDSFNRLILGAQLGWREVAVLRAYARYMKQIQFNFSSDFIADTLTNNLNIARLLVDYFVTRFSPEMSESTPENKEQDLVDTLNTALDQVQNLSEDRIIRQYITLISATLRTNYFQRDMDGNVKGHISFKLSPGDIPDVPKPVPLYEIFVYSPRVEGVHLRGGKVARGGLRWSDRMEDFRTEVLGLVKAQQVKNAVIVPTGAKGGFVPKRLAALTTREDIQAEGIACYQLFIQGLLDITDNIVHGIVVPPLDVVRKDGDDTYLVVAADKGTATFSDLANSIAEQYDFWLGDAFASGGSSGYDHKKMGITAKGGWVSVQRHFRELGVNIQEQDFTVIGIGDMSGDVFGNGMLLSQHIALVAAFNHQHIFIDPNPDVASSFAERERLFLLPRSGWGDYNAELISAGGGVFNRSAKSIALSPEIKARFAIEANKLTPNDFIHELLKAPVDLLWNGGIGTYIKSSNESHGDVGDKANDSLRVDAAQLRCRVIGEGGNLGVTQLGRVEFALAGGSVNTDFIDNAGGVDCSDHEVNIKILLNAIVTAGDMTLKQRNTLLEKMTDDVSRLVLRNNYRQTLAISLAEQDVLRRSGENRRLIHAMESKAKLDRQLEFLPTDEALAERRGIDRGLTRPELSILISYAKSYLKETLVASPTITDDDYLTRAAESAFPDVLVKKYRTQIGEHRLYREITATQIANDLVNTMGMSFIERMVQSTGAGAPEIAKAYVTARDVFQLPAYWEQIEKLDGVVPANVQMDMMSQLIRLVRRTSRWFVRNRRVTAKPANEIQQFQQPVAQLCNGLDELMTKSQRERWQKQVETYQEHGVNAELAQFVAGSTVAYSLLGIIEASTQLSVVDRQFASLYFKLAERLELDWFAGQIANLKIENYWQAVARESYRDDLEWQLRMLTSGAMRHICVGGDIDACLERWAEKQSNLLDRWRVMLTELHAAEGQDFAMFSVAIRELLDLAQSSKHDALAAS